VAIEGGLYAILDMMTKNLVLSPFLPSSPLLSRLLQRAVSRSAWMDGLTLLTTAGGAMCGTLLALLSLPSSDESGASACPPGQPLCHGLLSPGDAPAGVAVVMAVVTLLLSTMAALSIATLAQGVGLASLLLQAQGSAFVSSVTTYYRIAEGGSTAAPSPARRATEAYLLLQTLMQATARSCNRPILLWISLGALSTATAASEQGLIVFSKVGLTLAPLIFVAYANSYLGHLTRALTKSGWKDYEALGGRDRWLAYLPTNLASW
jgi:hypothetical protein